MERPVRARLTKSEGRRFAFPVGLAFLVIAGISLWRGHQTVPLVLGGIAGALLLAGALIPTLLGSVYRGWMGLAHAISKVTTPIFLGVVYFLVITPAGVVMRMFGRNPLRHSPEGGTYWRRRDEGSRRSDLTRQF